MESFEGIRFVLLYTLGLNLIVTVAKIGVGYLTGSLSIVADGFDSLFDSITNVIGLVAIHLARRPADEDHPYGHRRYEALMTLSVSVLLFLTCFGILRSAYERLLNPSVPEVNIWSFASLFLSIAIHAYTARYETRRGKELRSEFLIADASHTRADILVTVGVIFGLIVVKLGYPLIDTVTAVAIAVLIAKIGVDIIRGSARILVDAVAVDTAQVAAAIEQVPGIESYHHIRSRGQEDDVHLDLHVRVAPDMPLVQAHSIAHDVQRQIKSAVPGVRDVVVHVEPQPKAGDLQQTVALRPAAGDVRSRVREVASSLGIPVHHLAAHEIDGVYVVTLHLEVPETVTLGQAHAQASFLEDRVKVMLPEVSEVHTHIEPKETELGEPQGALAGSVTEQDVLELTRSIPGVHNCHKIDLRRTDHGLFLTLHCTLDEELPVVQAHEIATAVEDQVRNAYPGVTGVSVHVEPSESDTSV
jgi:cation diffusion facilitator family transporter